MEGLAYGDLEKGRGGATASQEERTRRNHEEELHRSQEKEKTREEQEWNEKDKKEWKKKQEWQKKEEQEWKIREKRDRENEEVTLERKSSGVSKELPVTKFNCDKCKISIQDKDQLDIHNEVMHYLGSPGKAVANIMENAQEVKSEFSEPDLLLQSEMTIEESSVEENIVEGNIEEENIEGEDIEEENVEEENIEEEDIEDKLLAVEEEQFASFSFSCETEDCEFSTEQKEELKAHILSLHLGMAKYVARPDPVEEMAKYVAKSDPMEEDEDAAELESEDDEVEFGDDGQPRVVARSIAQHHQCEKCKFSTAHKHNIKRHMATIHGGEIMEREGVEAMVMRKRKAAGDHDDVDPSKLLTCDKCDFVTTHIKSKRRHMMVIHEGLRHPCEMCSFQATQPYDLKKHYLKKHPEMEI